MNRILTSIGCNGVLAILLACMIWAGSGVFLKYSLEAVNPIWAALLKVFIILVFSLITFRPALGELLESYRRGRALFFSLAIFGVVIGFALSHYAVQHIPLGIAILIQRSKPVFIVVFAALMLGERLRAKQAPWLALAMASSVGIALPKLSMLSDSNYLFGVSAMFLAALCLGFNAALNKMAVNEEYETGQIIALRFGLGLLLLAPMTMMLPLQEPGVVLEVSHIASVVVSGLLTSLGFVFYYHALKFTPISELGGWELSTGVFSVVLGWMVFGEELTMFQLMFIPALFLALVKLKSA